MARVLRFDRGRHGNANNIDAVKVWQYVLPRLGFPLPDFISDEIDFVIGEIWNSSEGDISFQQCVDALDSLARHDIMIPPARREKIVALIFEYLSRNGYISEGG
ncbi:MAG TPA: hypothetical protein VMM82_07355 [Spirochaetia bacterium]|nr:hypothetical protein [Spirochaetia bacterium]